MENKPQYENHILLTGTINIVHEAHVEWEKVMNIIITLMNMIKY